MTTNTGRFAQKELSILSKLATDPENRPIIEPFIPEILALCDKFGNSGQSGGLAPFTASALSKAIKTLCLQEPICPIMDLPEEWFDVSKISDLTKGRTLFQNNRCSALFREDDQPVYYLDAISFIPVGKSYGMHISRGVMLDDGSKIGSRQRVKKFPFTPKTFYIDIIEIEVAKDDWEYKIKNERQLKSVFKYYDRFPV